MTSDITSIVVEMYSRFPFPSNKVDRERLKEQSYLLQLFAMENKLDLAGARILDAGTGTGHRLAQIARAFPSTRFTGVDLCDASLAIAKQVAEHEKIGNVSYQKANLMSDLSELGTFDLVLSIGVLHHLASPETGLGNLVRVMKPSGAIILWLYGEPGGRERNRRHRIIRTLLNGNREDYDKGIQLAKDLEFNDFEFGWDLGNITESERDGLIVDAFLNINEKLYDVDSIHDLMRSSGLAGYAISGITRGNSAYLFDTTPDQPAVLNCNVTDLGTHLKSPLLRESFQDLSILDRYRLADLFCEPAGYTVIGFTEAFVDTLPADSRLYRTLVRL